MSASAHLLQSLTRSPAAPLRTIQRIRVHLHKESHSTAQQTSLRHFINTRLPALRFSNPALVAEVRRVLTEKDGKAGIELVKGSESFIIDHSKLKDDELFTTILSLDKAKPTEIGSLKHVKKGDLGQLAAKPAAAAAAKA